MTDDELRLRRMLWLHHGCPVEFLYSDDGEMQCGSYSHECGGIDFIRDSVEDLEVELTPPANRELFKMMRDGKPTTEGGK